MTRHSIITGGSSGIGKAIALELAREGSHVSIVARDEARLAVAKAEIEAARRFADQEVLALSVDVSDRAAVIQTMAAAIDQLGRPHQLITCAGVARPGHFQELSAEIFERAMSVNYFGTLYCIQAVLPSMQAVQAGQICLVSSGAGLLGLYGYSAYGASKFAVRGLAESLRAELKPEGIQVAIAYPPDTDTPQLLAENKTKPAATKEITATAKLWQPEAVATVVLQGMEKGKFVISPGLEISVLTRLHSLILPLLNRYFDRIVSRYPR
ncbi:MAG: SDR family oxidoreductase [Cyanobacteria bacterium J06650_10]